MEKGTPSNSTLKDGNRHDHKASRSCLTCHRRKIKCDKLLPCTNCSRAQSPCSYPKDGKIRRLKRTPVATILGRIETLERTFEALSESQTPARDAGTGFLQGSSTTTAKQSGGGHLIVNKGDASTFFSNRIFASVAEEADEIRASQTPASVTSAESSSSMSRGSAWAIPYLVTSPASTGELAGSPSEDPFPSPWQALQLWQAYVNNVDPIMKVLHIPSIKPQLYAAIKDMRRADATISLLLVGIFFAAATSLNNEDTLRLLSCTKAVTLQRLRRQVELALAKSNVIHNPCIRSLQALTIYLTAIRAYDNSRDIWTLTGLAIRIAHSIGLHRDGSQLGLSAFETEERRRCWWHLIILDTRAGEDYGLSSNGVDRSCDTRYPLNLDDHEFSAETEQMPEHRARWTEMSFSLIRIEGGDKLIRKGLDAHGIDILEKKQRIQSFSQHLDATYLSYPDTNAPVQAAGSVFARLSVQKADFLLDLEGVQHNFLSGKPTPAVESLDKACALLENVLALHRDDLLQSFRWLFRSYTQWFALALVLRHLTANPNAIGNQTLVPIIRNSFTLLAEDEALQNKGTIWTALCLLRDKALRQLSESSTLIPPENGSVSSVFEQGLFGDGFNGVCYDENMFDVLDWSQMIQLE